jgi:hypothetical protein
MKVVHLVEGHNFHVDWHFNFEWKSLKNMFQRQLYCSRNRLTFKDGNCVLQICREKSHITFLKMIEGS